MISYVIAGIIGAVLYSLGALALKMIKEGGMAEQKAKEAESAASITKDQAEIIAQPKTTDETIADLDNNRF